MKKTAWTVGVFGAGTEKALELLRAAGFVADVGRHGDVRVYSHTPKHADDARACLVDVSLAPKKGS